MAQPDLVSPPHAERGTHPGAGRPRWASGAAWAALAVVLALALAWGSGALGGTKSAHLSLYQRTMATAGKYRCPVCAGESVAASQASEAVEIKALISNWLAHGRTQAQIRSYLLADYGPSILERPPASGLDVLLWVLPAAVVVAGAGGLGLAFRRWRRLAASGPGEPGGEPDAGPPTGQDVITKDPDVPAPATRAERPRWLPPPRRVPRATAGAGLALMAAAGVLLWVDHSVANRQPGQTVTGGPVNIDLELQQAAALTVKNPVAALAVYGRVLAAAPGQPTALTEEGWIYAQAGLSSRGMALLDRVEKEDPAFDLAHLYRGLVLLDYSSKPAQAAGEFRFYLAHGPQPSLVPAAKKALGVAMAVQKRGSGLGTKAQGAG